MVKILALDIASISTGYCVFNKGKLLKSSCGIIDTKKGIYGQRVQKFSVEINDLISKYNPDEIVIENIYRGRNILTFKTLAMFRGAAILTVYNATEKDPLDMMAVKAREIVGTGKSKEEAYDFAVKKYKLSDFSFEKDNDRTDAIILGLAAHIAVRDGIDLKPKKKKRRKKKKKAK